MKMKNNEPKGYERKTKEWTNTCIHIIAERNLNADVVSVYFSSSFAVGNK